MSVNLTTLFLGRLRPPKWLTSTLCTYFHQSVTTALLETVEAKTKVGGQTRYRTWNLWLLSQMPYRLRYAARESDPLEARNTSNKGKQQTHSIRIFWTYIYSRTSIAHTPLKP